MTKEQKLDEVFTLIKKHNLKGVVILHTKDGDIKKVSSYVKGNKRDNIDVVCTVIDTSPRIRNIITGAIEDEWCINN